MHFRRTLVVALLCALPMLSAAAQTAASAEATPEPEKVKWILPWKDGTSLTYAMEDTRTDDTKATRERTRSTTTAVVRITESSPEGFVQTWTSSGGKYEVLEGDKAGEAQMKAFSDALEDVPVAVQLDAAGNFKQMRNIDIIVPRFQAAVRPMVDGMIEAELSKIADEALRAKRREEAKPLIDKMLATMTSPAMLEALISRDIAWYNGFVGIDIPPDQAYELEAELPSPLGGPAIPAKLTFSLSVSEDDPDDLYVSYHQAADSEQAKEAMRGNADRITGGTLSKEALAKVEATVLDEGFFVVHRPTGVVEMFESTRTTTVQGKQKIERHRLRLLNGDHDHEWKDETAQNPQPAAKDA